MDHLSLLPMPQSLTFLPGTYVASSARRILLQVLMQESR